MVSTCQREKLPISICSRSRGEISCLHLRKIALIPRKNAKICRNNFHSGSRPHSPLRFEAVDDFVPRSHHFLWDPADSIRTRTDALQLLCRHCTSITTNAARIGRVIGILKPRRRGKVKCSKSTRFSKGVSTWWLANTLIFA